MVIKKIVLYMPRFNYDGPLKSQFTDRRFFNFEALNKKFVLKLEVTSSGIRSTFCPEAKKYNFHGRHSYLHGQALFPSPVLHYHSRTSIIASGPSLPVSTFLLQDLHYFTITFP